MYGPVLPCRPTAKYWFEDVPATQSKRHSHCSMQLLLPIRRDSGRTISLLYDAQSRTPRSGPTRPRGTRMIHDRRGHNTWRLRSGTLTKSGPLHDTRFPDPCALRAEIRSPTFSLQVKSAFYQLYWLPDEGVSMPDCVVRYQRSSVGGGGFQG